MNTAERIERKLRDALSPEQLRVTDDSHRHAGHAGARPEGETHYDVEVVSSAFAGMSRLERQRWVYRILADELAGGVHALALRTATPEEADRD